MKNGIRSVLFTILLVSVAANVSSHEINAYVAASQEFEKIAAENTALGHMPRLDNKRVAELIAILSDSQRFLYSTPYQVGDLGTLINMCAKSNAIVMSYALFDMKNQLKKGDDPAVVDQQERKVMNKNFLSYQNELEQLQPFLFRCVATEIPLLTEFALALKPEEYTEARRAGLQKMRNGVFSVYYGALQGLNNPGLRKTFREKIVQTLAETAAPFAGIILPASRQQILDLATMAQQTASGRIDASLRKIIDVMSRTECVGLCQK